MWGMSKKYPRIYSYKDAERVYNETKPLRGRADFRPLDRRSSSATSQILAIPKGFVIRLYATDIITYMEDGTIFLCTGRWNTPTTARAIYSMSPFACWIDKQRTIVRMPDNKNFVIPKDGLQIKDGVPLNPVPAFTSKKQVDKEKAKKVRAFFKDTAKLIATISALNKQAHRNYVPLNYSMIIDSFVRDKPLPIDQTSQIAQRYVARSFSWMVARDAHYPVKVFWKDMYANFNVIEEVLTPLPLGQV